VLGWIGRFCDAEKRGDEMGHIGWTNRIIGHHGHAIDSFLVIPGEETFEAARIAAISNFVRNVEV